MEGTICLLLFTNHHTSAGVVASDTSHKTFECSSGSFIHVICETRFGDMYVVELKTELEFYTLEDTGYYWKDGEAGRKNAQIAPGDYY
ncbi:hypothetical protein N7535_001969 [Penicillium sp. DV-2018c]|nr:hypothetical protein N7535_001969 [Penicillium sp. DV-2018c]